MRTSINNDNNSGATEPQLTLLFSCSSSGTHPTDRHSGDDFTLDGIDVTKRNARGRDDGTTFAPGNTRAHAGPQKPTGTDRLTTRAHRHTHTPAWDALCRDSWRKIHSKSCSHSLRLPSLPGKRICGTGSCVRLRVTCTLALSFKDQSTCTGHHTPHTTHTYTHRTKKMGKEL